MKPATSAIRGKVVLLSLGVVLPLFLVMAIKEVPRFVYAACDYYCDPAEFELTASPSVIALNESTLLEATGAPCPCSWQIDSQPGG